MSATTKITRDDLEAKLREIVGEVDERVEEARPSIIAGAVVVLAVVGLLAYLLGRRSGRVRSAVVEIRRV
ncbi:MAG TPA: hypothetical protein VEI83_10605 [Acidimicrobiales bacterium]|nr:hypothetical protein [Acidimicrobiales bacterium]